MYPSEWSLWRLRHYFLTTKYYNPILSGQVPKFRFAKICYPPPLNFDEEVLSTSHLGKQKEREAETTDAERESDPDDEEWEAELNESLAPATTEIRTG